MIVLIVIVAVAVIVFVILYFVMVYGKDEDDESEESETLEPDVFFDDNANQFLAKPSGLRLTTNLVSTFHIDQNHI